MSKRRWIAWVVGLGLLTLVAGCAGQLQLAKGEMRLKSQQYAEAVPFFQEAVTADPGNCMARAKLGFALYKTGQIDPAIIEFKKALEIRPGEPLATLYLGMAYASKEEIGKAIEVWKGYTNPGQPIVAAEIQRQLTLVQIAHSHKLAQTAMAQEATLGARPPAPDSVAVCYFADLTSDKRLGAFQKGLAAMVIADLGKIKSVKVVERVQLQALLSEMRLGQTGIVDPKTAPRVGRLLGAEKLMIGSLASGSIQAAMSLSSSTRSAVLGSTQMSVATEEFYSLPAGLIKAMADIAGIVLSPAEVAAIGIPHTKSLKAFTYYGQALEAMDVGDYKKAKDLFDMAIAEDPQFQMAHEGLRGCPGGDAPGSSELASMPINQLVSHVGVAVSRAEADQATADAAAAAAEAEAASGGGY